ncbi:MAG TPA: hypothetical protein ENG85_00980 [Bacteroidetes bacterium]|nr:hypothetical protein [Bacteroidota bacterium]
MSKQTIRSIGIISKKEKLIPAERLSDCKIMILESAYPFPGYHGTTVPDKSDPDSVFLITKQAYNDDKIIRSIMDIRKEFPFAFDGAPGTITMNNKMVHVIRLKNLGYMYIPELVEPFRIRDIEFMKKKKLSEFNSLIKIRKFFQMQEAGEGVFQDMEQDTFTYLHIPCTLRWNTFEKMTMDIKYNIKDNKFDAAIGHVYRKDGMFDFVRIYDKNFNLEKLTYIREKYLEHIANL